MVPGRTTGCLRSRNWSQKNRSLKRNKITWGAEMFWRTMATLLAHVDGRRLLSVARRRRIEVCHDWLRVASTGESVAAWLFLSDGEEGQAGGRER